MVQFLTFWSYTMKNSLKMELHSHVVHWWGEALVYASGFGSFFWQSEHWFPKFWCHYVKFILIQNILTNITPIMMAFWTYPTHQVMNGPPTDKFEKEMEGPQWTWLGDYLRVLTYNLMELKVGFICKWVAMVCSWNGLMCSLDMEAFHHFLDPWTKPFHVQLCD
jgi:hypothetical protein